MRSRAAGVQGPTLRVGRVRSQPGAGGSSSCEGGRAAAHIWRRALQRGRRLQPARQAWRVQFRTAQCFRFNKAFLQRTHTSRYLS